MAGEAEKRFQKVMDKLYYAPRHNNAPITARVDVRGGKRVEDEQKGIQAKTPRLPRNTTGAAATREVPPCRPWDRGDLTRRLATFKAMTWFGKPKVVDAVHCARKGWINVEADTIACEACGARALFSTPLSWTLEQIEKAAAVFSLKLDSGHKLLCPWIDNACAETLVLFSRVPPQALIEGYKDRSFMLLQLSSLPKISVSAMDYMMIPELDRFLSQSSLQPIILHGDITISEASGSLLEGGDISVMSDPYYQALKIISMCGWKPHSRPYFVDFADQSNPRGNEGSLFQNISDQLRSNVVCTSTGYDETEAGAPIDPNLSTDLYDPASVVLECKLCGARIGLWAFETVPRPLEVFLLTSSSDCNGIKELGTFADPTNAKSSSSDTAVVNRSVGLSSSIAGGPPATKQKFKARVSFPIVSRFLRTQFCPDSSLSKIKPASSSFLNQEKTGPLGIDSVSQRASDLEGVDSTLLDNTGSLKRRRDDNENCSPKNVEINPSPLEERNECSNNVETEEGSFLNVPGDVRTAHETAEYATDREVLPEMLDPCRTMQCTEIVSETNFLISSPDADRRNYHTPSVMESLIHGDVLEVEHHDPSCEASCSIMNETPSKAVDMKFFQQGGEAKSDHTLEMGSKPHNVNNKEHASGSALEPAQSNGLSGFDPIKHHRTFCPWIASVDGKSIPGWKLTLSALDGSEKDSSSTKLAEASCSLPDEADDPIASIRKIFASPLSAKRLRRG